MGKLQELLDQLKDAFMVRWEQFQETDLYIQLREKYDNLSPVGQKGVLFGSIFLVFIVIFLTPYGWYSTSEEYEAYFEDNQNTIVNLLEVAQEAKKIPPQSQTLPSNDLKMRMERILSEKGIAKEQISNFSEVKLTNPPGSVLIPTFVDQNAVEINLKKLTLKQIVDLNYEFDRISPLAKVLTLEMKATQEDNHYYDTLFKVSSFSVPEPAQPKNQPRQRQ